jgi:hypothetical protein
MGGVKIKVLESEDVMMAQSELLVREDEMTLGDAAVDGLLVGIGAGVLMAAYLALTALAAGENMAAVLSRFDPSPTPSPLTGLFMHLAVAGVYGIVFGLARRLSPRRWGRLPGWLIGLVYGWGLVGLAWTVILPGTGSALLSLSFLRLAGAHAVYGLALGTLMDRTMAAAARS